MEGSTGLEACEDLLLLELESMPCLGAGGDNLSIILLSEYVDPMINCMVSISLSSSMDDWPSLWTRLIHLRSKRQLYCRSKIRNRYTAAGALDMLASLYARGPESRLQTSYGNVYHTPYKCTYIISNIMSNILSILSAWQPSNNCHSDICDTRIARLR